MITTRHLLYHVCPMAGNGTWQRNVLHLRKRIGLFNGSRVVGIVTGDGLDQPEAVQELFRGTVEDWIVLPNDPAKREVKTFFPLLHRVYSHDPSEATFYAHTKGVKHPVDPHVSVHPWTRIMYETCLDYWPLVDRVLQDHAMAGSFKKLGGGWESSKADWFYSGTFYWFRNAELFRRTWPHHDRTWWGTESYPGLQFRAGEGACLFHEDPHPGLNPYRIQLMRGVVLPRYEVWKKEHEHERTVWGDPPRRTDDEFDPDDGQITASLSDGRGTVAAGG